jgi:biotin transport system substrate-specific component
LSNVSLAIGRPTLADRIFTRSLATDVILVVVGAAFTAVLAQLVIPLWPVPITGQTLAVLLVGATLGLTRGAISLAFYAVLGLVGLPVYAPQTDGSHLTGLVALHAPSFGYIVGFILAAALVGWLAQLRWDRNALKVFVSFVAGSLVVYAVGVPWLMAVTGLSLPSALMAGVVPFLIGDTIKALIAAALLPLAWLGVNRLKGKPEAK